MDFPILNHDLELKEIDFQCTLSTLGTRNNNCHLTSIITCIYIYIYIYMICLFFFFGENIIVTRYDYFRSGLVFI